MVILKKGGVLVHKKGSELGKKWLRVVVPSVRRQQILDLAHKGLAGGHFLHNKMVASLQPHFTWPGIRKDTRQYCSTGSIVALALNVKGQADTSNRKFDVPWHLLSLCSSSEKGRCHLCS